MKELISIIVPVYNIENYLDKCIESIVHQTYKNLEILLIDDGSTDHSGKKCDEWAKKDKRIRVIHKKNGGVSSARNIGLEKAKGEYIGFVDGDDFVNKKMYEEMHRQMKKNNADFVICDYNECYNQNDNFKDRGKENNLIEILDKNGMFDKVYPYRGYVWQGLFLKEKLSAEVRFDSTKYVAEDLKFVCEYIANCDNKGVYIKRELYNYVKRNDSITAEANLSKKELSNGVINLLESEKESMEIIENNCIDEGLLTKMKKSIVTYYWITIYDLLKHDFKCNMKQVKEYSNEVKAYKKYFSKKDKLYMMLISISPRLFKNVCKGLRILKKKAKVEKDRNIDN